MSEDKIKAAIAAKIAAMNASVSAEPIGPPSPDQEQLERALGPRGGGGKRAEVKRRLAILKAKKPSGRFLETKRKDLFNLLRKQARYREGRGMAPLSEESIRMFLRSIDLEYEQLFFLERDIRNATPQVRMRTGLPRGRRKRHDIQQFVRAVASGWEAILGVRPRQDENSQFFAFIVEAIGDEHGNPRTYIRDEIARLGWKDETIDLTEAERAALGGIERAHIQDWEPRKHPTKDHRPGGIEKVVEEIAEKNGTTKEIVTEIFIEESEGTTPS